MFLVRLHCSFDLDKIFQIFSWLHWALAAALWDPGSPLWHAGLVAVACQVKGLIALRHVGSSFGGGGMEPESPAVEGGFVTMGPPGNSQKRFS